MKKVGLIPNLQKEKALELSNELYCKLKNYDIEVYLTPESTIASGNTEVGANVEYMAKNVDLVMVLGGDGTLLKVARDFVFYDIPILGVNVGKIGFLTEFEIGEINGYLKDIVEGNFEARERMMLEGCVIRDGKEICSFIALNDAVISKGSFSRIVELETKIDGNKFETYPGDGIIVATSTGSTGYNLSAGGPVVNPELKTLVITPICPHLLHARSILTSPDELVCIKVKTHYEMVALTVDGQQGFTLQKDDEVKIWASKYCTKLVKFKEKSFYTLLNRKLVERKE